MLALVVLSRGYFVVGHFEFEHAVDENGELASGRRHGLGLSRSSGQPAIGRPKRMVAAAESHGRDSKDLGCPVRRGLRAEGSPAPGRLRGAGFVLGWTVILIFPLSQAPIATLLTTLIAIKAATCLNFLKSSMEHGGGYRAIEDQRLKTRGLTFPLMNLCFPFCITPYHWEHHLVPAIPWYRLPHFRKTIADEIPEDRREWIYTPGPELLRQVILP